MLTFVNRVRAFFTHEWCDLPSVADIS